MCPPFFLSLSFTHALPLFLSTHIVFPSLSFSSSSCLYVFVSPVLTPPESEKADSEDRVSLKVCSQQFLSSFSSFFLVKIHAVNPLQTLHPFLTAHEEHADNNLPLCLFLVFLFLSLDTPFLSDTEESRGSLHPHLCGSVQVSASGEERLGTTVSQVSLYTLLCVCKRVCTWPILQTFMHHLPPQRVDRRGL